MNTLCVELLRHCNASPRYADCEPVIIPITSGSRGTHPAPPPNGRRLMICVCPTRKIFSFFFLLGSLAIHFKPTFNGNRPKHPLKRLILQPSTFVMFFYPPSCSVGKVHAPPLQSQILDPPLPITYDRY